MWLCNWLRQHLCKPTTPGWDVQTWDNATWS